MILECLHCKMRMLSVCHPSYQYSEAIVQLNLNARHPREHQYSHNYTDTLMIDNINAELL